MLYQLKAKERIQAAELFIGIFTRYSRPAG